MCRSAWLLIGCDPEREPDGETCDTEAAAF